MESSVSHKTTTRSATDGSRIHWECWFWAAAFLSGFVILAVLKIHGANSPVDEFKVFNNARLERFAAHPARHKVIMLGDSRLKYATLPDENMAALATGSDASVAFLRIVQNQAQFSDFEPFLDGILNAKPDLLILQKPLLTRHRHNNVELRELQKFAVWALTDGDGTWNPDGVDQQSLQYATPCTSVEPMSETISDQEFDAAVDEVRKRGTPDAAGPNAAAALAFVDAARHAGAHVVVLNAPATRSYWRIVAEVFPDSGLDTARSGVEEWAYPGEFPARDYCDLLHLLPDARATYSEWLAFEAVEALERRDRTERMAQSRQ